MSRAKSKEPYINPVKEAKMALEHLNKKLLSEEILDLAEKCDIDITREDSEGLGVEDWFKYRVDFKWGGKTIFTDRIRTYKDKTQMRAIFREMVQVPAVNDAIAGQLAEIKEVREERIAAISEKINKPNPAAIY